MRDFRTNTLKKLALVFFLASAVSLALGGCATQNSGSQAGDTGADTSAAAITAIALSEETDALNVVIDGTAPLTYTSVKQPMPLGVVLYFPNTRLNVADKDLTSAEAPVTAVHATQVQAKNDTSRVEILLAADVSYNVVQDGRTLRIKFAKAGAGTQKVEQEKAASMATAAASSNASSAAPALTAPPEPSGTFQGTGAPVVPDGRIWVNRIDFLGEPDGRSTLSIETTAKVDYSIQKVNDKLIELRLKNANIAEFRQRPLITTRFESAVNRIMPIQLPSMKDFSLFSIELRQPVAYYVEQIGDLLLVHFDASTVPPAPLDEANLPPWKKALTEAIGAADVAPPASSVQPLQKSQSEAKDAFGETIKETVTVSQPTIQDVYDVDESMIVTRNVKKYKGEKIALDFYQTDIKNVFRILREVSGKNFAIDKDVTGKVTLTLDKPVPWDQVMDLVLRMNQLGMIVEGNIIRIATLSTLKKENDLRKAQIAALQKEKAQIKALEPLETRYIPVSYSNASKDILPHLQNIITKGRGSVSVDGKNNQIIITDTADKIAQAQAIAREIDKVTSQVIIEARVVEVSESFSKELGFSWNAGVGPISINRGKIEGEGSVAMNFPTGSTNGFGFNLTRIFNTEFSLDAQLTALETNGNGKILSSPKIVTLNNQKARIKQGQEYGYLERDSAGGSSVKFKDVDLLLEVTPHVTPDNRISLTILIKKNDVTGQLDGVPIISTNEAETQLLVNDGDTIVIGGIIKASSTKGQTAFPGLYKIPVLGWMFQSNSNEQDSNELLIFMNPKIVQLEQRAHTF